jgi:PAS domain S-box-containing protein
VRFTWLNDLSFEEMLTRVASLPPRSFVLLGLLLRDAKGVTYNQDEALVRLHAVANAPINGMYQNQIGLGIVGGRLYQGELEGVEAARVAVRILRGAAAADIPPQIIHTQKPRYDWRELQRWGISESRLPLGSLVEFRAPPVWQQYWAWIIGAVLVGALQVGLIALLGVNLGNRRRAERALRESEERFRTVADSAPVMIWMSGVDKRCTFFNKPWLDFAGAPAEPDMSDGWAEGVHPDERARMLKDFAEAFDTRQPFVLDYRRRRHDGEYRWVSDHGVPRYDARGKFAGYIGSCSDVTERRQAEMEAHDLRQDLTHMSRVATMGELTAAIVHEISQPLTAIRGNADAALRLIAAGKRDQGQMGEILEDIAASGRRAGQVIQHLRSLFKKGEAERELLLLNDVVDEVVSLVGRDAAGLRDVAVERDLAPRMLPVSGDRIQLQHVVLNLAMNALDAMAEQEKRRRRLTVRTRAIGVGWVQLEVTDTGSGIPAEKLDSIFTPFVTTKAKGMGMGLAVSSTIVQAHGGTIAAENRPEGGAVFRVTLPVAPELSSVSAS